MNLDDINGIIIQQAPLDDSTPENMYPQIEDHLIKAFHEQGNIDPVVFIFTKENVDIVLWMEGGIPYPALKFLYRGRATGYIMASESWYLEAKNWEDISHDIRPSESPDRKEGVILVGATKDDHWKKFTTWEIVRSGAGADLIRNSLSSGTETDFKLSSALWDE